MDQVLILMVILENKDLKINSDLELKMEIVGLSWCETPRKSNFLKKVKMVISVKIRNFSRSRMTKRTSPLESSREI